MLTLRVALLCFPFTAAGISAIVEQDYTAKETGELSLNRGAIIQNVRQQSNGLWEGSVAGKTGLFRDTFVRFLDSSSSNSNHNTAGAGAGSGADKDFVVLR